MRYSTFIGSRYLRSRKKSSISAIGIIAIAGVALGVASLVVVVSIASAFHDEFTKKVLGVNSHVIVTKYGILFTEYRDVMEKIEKIEEVRGVAPFFIQNMMISKGERTAGILLKGVDPERLGNVLDLPSHITKGSLEGLRLPGSSPAKARDLKSAVDAALPEIDELKEEKGETKVVERGLPGIVLGSTLAENLDAQIGDTVQVTTPFISLDIVNWKPSDQMTRALPFKVVGIFYAGFLEYDTKLAYVDYFQAQRFFDHGDTVTGVEITVYDISQARQVSAKIREALGPGPYNTIDWEMLNEHLFTALKMQKVVLTVVLAVIVGVAAFNIIATLVMMVFDKRREIAILKSMGATRGGIARVFLYIGTVVGSIGIAIGLAAGLVICLLLQEIGWPLDPGVYLIDHLPVRIDPLDFILTAAVAFAICLMATILPSMSASRLHPVDGIRQD